MRICRVMMFGAALAIPVMAQAQSAPGWQQTLQGLMTGNQGQDDSLRQAYQRGYQRGRDDEARAMQANNRTGRYQDRYGADTRHNDEGYPDR
jgi:hypothetical protein